MNREKVIAVVGGVIVIMLLALKGYLWYADRPAGVRSPAEQQALAKAIEEAKRQQMQKVADEVSEKLREQIRQQMDVVRDKALLIGTWTEDDGDEVLTLLADGTFLARTDTDANLTARGVEGTDLPDMSGSWSLEEKRLTLSLTNPPIEKPLEGQVVSVTGSQLTIQWKSGNTDSYTRQKKP